jgi:RHS repeat-associated protein
VTKLSLLGTVGIASAFDEILAARFHAHPFTEPMTGMNYVRARWFDPASGSFVSPDPNGYRDSSNPFAFSGADPINYTDPLGGARRTRNGGVNWLADLGDIAQVRSGPWYVRNWTMTLSGGLDFAGNTLSDLLLLDVWADANVVAGDSSRPGKERAWAATKGLGVAALNLAGGEIVSTTGKVLLRVPGASTVISSLVRSKAGRYLATDIRYFIADMRPRHVPRPPRPAPAGRLDYSSTFLDEMKNSMPGTRVLEGELTDDLVLVQYHDAAVPLGGGRSAKYWTTVDDVNPLSTVDDVMELEALLPEWGARDAVSIARIPKGTHVSAFVGRVSPQVSKSGRIYYGQGIQFRFKDFDPSWIVQTRTIPE